MSDLIFVGIDVSKAHLDVAVRPTGAVFRAANTPAGLVDLLARLAPLGPTLIVLEATGGYELPALAACQAAKLAIAAVDPRQARDFAKGVGKLAKTDRIDAVVLAHFAEAVRPPARPAEPAERLALDALPTRRRQLIEMRVMESNRLEAVTDATVRAGIERHLAWLESEAEDADRRLDEAVKASPAWRAQDELLRSIPGVGPVVSRTRLAALPEAGHDRRGPGRGVDRAGPLRPRQRDDEGTAGDPRRAIRGASGDVPGGARGLAWQGAAEGLRQPAARPG